MEHRLEEEKEIGEKKRKEEYLIFFLSRRHPGELF